MKRLWFSSDELRNMNNMAVTVELIKSSNHGITTGVVTMTDPNDSDNGVYLGGTLYSINSYGEQWVAYEYNPNM